MLQNERRERQEKLGRLIYQLAEKMLNGTEEEYQTHLNHMKEIYEGGFRHTYSKFFPVVSKIIKDDNEYSIDYLLNNLNLLNTYLEETYPVEDSLYDRNMYIQVTKLCDHLNLQISQLSYLTSTEKKTEDASERLYEVEKKLEQTYKRIDEANEKLKKSQEDLENTNKELQKSHHDLEEVNKSLERSSICGMVIFNTIFLLLYLVSKLIKRELFVMCEKESCGDCDNLKCKKSKVQIIKKRLPYVYYFNFICIIGIGIDLLIWILDMCGFIG